MPTRHGLKDSPLLNMQMSDDWARLRKPRPASIRQIPDYWYTALDNSRSQWWNNPSIVKSHESRNRASAYFLEPARS